VKRESRSITGNWQLATGNWQLATGNWQLATGNWQLSGVGLLVMPTHGRVAVFPGSSTRSPTATRRHQTCDCVVRRTRRRRRHQSDKRELFTLDERFEMIRDLTKGLPSVRVETYTGLTVDFVASPGRSRS
jgi:hypothetical protein